MTDELHIEWWPLERIRPYPRNARKIPQAAIDAVAKSIREFGWRQPIVVDTEGVIVAGHVRLKAAEQLAAPRAPVHVAGNLTPAQIRQYRLMDNRSHDEATWDLPVLSAELLDMRALDLDLSLTGFSAREIDQFTVTADPAEDEVPPVPEAPVTRAGDLWALGGHQVLCGDSTDIAIVERLMGDSMASLVYTDPPYGVSYDGGTVARDKLVGDENTDLYAPCCRMAAHFSKSTAALYLWHAGVKGIAAAAAAAAAGYEIRCELVWNKNLAQFGALSAQYKQKHEPCYYCFRKPPKWFGPTNEVTVWDCARAGSNEFHPTQKPVELARRAMRNSSSGGDVVLDLFLGSGATIIAAEMLDRVGYGCELSPAYCDVILTRWQNFTGREATLADGDHKGATFAHVREGRRREWEDNLLEEALTHAKPGVKS